jgi:predicted transcriptional regulator
LNRVLRVDTELQLEEVLEVIGLDRTRKDMVILGALLKAQKEPTDFIDFETLREQLTIDEGSRKGKNPLIYRSLSKLEKEGFVKIDRGGHKHGYNSSIAILERALTNMVDKNIRSLEKELKEIDSEVATFSEMNSDIMAAGVIELLAGRRKIEKPVFARGWDNILKILDDKVYKNLKKGDVIRITLEWLTQVDYLKPKRTLIIERLLERGVEIRALDHDRSEKELRLTMRELLVKTLTIGGDVGYRIFPREDATYQFISRNEDGIMLVVSESPLSATWLPRSGNVELVDDAIESFDADYADGTNLLDIEG